MSYLTRHPQYLRLVFLSQAEIDAPTPAQLADHTTIYQLNVAPYTRYVSNSTSTALVVSGETGSSSVDVATVQVMIDAASILDRARANHTGTDPASSVLVAFNGKTVEQCMVEIYSALAGAGPTAPQITTDPTISDTTPAVAQTLTVTPGTVTGGAHTETYFWSANGVPVTALTTSTTYVVGAAYAGQVITVTQRSTLNSGGLYSERTSAATSAVTATVPTNSVAPTITPTGSQAVGTTYSVSSLGTWADDTSATVSYQWQLDDADITGATSSTYTSIVGQEGGVIKLRVMKTTSQGSSIWYTSSNSSTVSGSATLTISTNPAFPSTVTVGTAATITNSTWTGGTPTYVNTRIYVAEGTGGTTTPYATITANPAVYTPESNNNSFLLSATGLTTLVGKTVYCDQQWILSGTTYTSPKSASKTVADVSSTLAARTDTPSMTFTQNAAITPVRPVAGTGGTAPYTYSIDVVSGALPSGLTLTASGASAGYISGTPTVTSAQASYNIIVTDSVGATASASVTVTVSAASVTPLSFGLSFISATDYGIDAPFSGQGTDYSEKSARFDSGFTGGNATYPFTVPPVSNVVTVTGNSSIVNFGPITESGTGLPAILHRIRSTDPTRHSGHRSGMVFDSPSGVLVNGVDYWFAMAFRLVSGWDPASGGGSGDQASIFDIHSNGVSNPFGLQLRAGGTGAGILWYVAAYDAAGNGSDVNLYNVATAPLNQWWRTIIHARMGSAGQSPICEAWYAAGNAAYTKLTAAYGNPATTPWGDATGGLFFKDEVYKWTTTAYGSNTNRLSYSSGVYVGSGINKYDEAAAAIASYATNT